MASPFESQDQPASPFLRAGNPGVPMPQGPEGQGGRTEFPFVPSGRSPTENGVTKPVGPVGSTGLPQPRTKVFESQLDLEPRQMPVANFQPVPVPDPSTEQTVAFRLNELLASVDLAKLGFDPKRIPATVETKLPWKALRPQFQTGRVEVPLAWVVAGLDERLRPAFAKADQDLPIQLPFQEMRQQLPRETFSPVVQSPFEVQVPQVAAVEEVQPFSIPSLFSPRAESAAASPFSKAVPDSSTGWTVPAAVAAPSFKPAQPIVYQDQPAQITMDQPILYKSEPAPKPAMSMGGALQQSLNLVTEVTESPTQILMRAVLGTSEPLTLRQILGHTSRIPGVMSSVAIQNDRVILPDMDASETEVKDFASHALSRHTKVKELLREFGNEHFEIFTVTLGARTVSFFAAKDCTLAVLHREPMLPAGVREKLLVIVRNLGELL